MYLISGILFLSALLSGMSAYLFNRQNKTYLKLLLSFSGAYLFAICMLHLIPEVYSTGKSTVGLFVLSGFFLQILLELFSEGIEHGHMHLHKSQDFQFPLTIMLGLCIHSFLEGMPLAKFDSDSYNSLLIGIILHNIPVALALATMLIDSELNKKSVVSMLIVFAAMAPLGATVSSFIGNNMMGDISIYFDNIIAVVIGIFLHISTTILFEASENHRFNLIKFATILLGAFAAWMFSF